MKWNEWPNNTILHEERVRKKVRRMRSEQIHAVRKNPEKKTLKMSTTFAIFLRVQYSSTKVCYICCFASMPFTSYIDFLWPLFGISKFFPPKIDQ